MPANKLLQQRQNNKIINRRRNNVQTYIDSSKSFDDEIENTNIKLNIPNQHEDLQKIQNDVNTAHKTITTTQTLLNIVSTGFNLVSKTYGKLPALVGLGALGILGILAYFKNKDGSDGDLFDDTNPDDFVDFNGYYIEDNEKNKIKNKIIDEAKKQGVDPNLALAVAEQESNFNPKAQSDAGAKGIFQLRPINYKSFGIDPFNVDQNIRVGVTLLKGHLKKYNGDQAKALAAYNWGSGNLAKYGLENAPAETRNYITSIANSEAKFKEQRSKLPSKYFNARGGGEYGTWNGKRITSAPGKRFVTDSTGRDIGASTDHKGIDIVFKEGERVYAYVGGKVTHCGFMSGFGNTIIINDSKAYRHIYGHLSGFAVKQGQHVVRGQLIGYAGHTGVASGPHLHYGIWKPGGGSDADYIDPRTYQYPEEPKNDTSGTPQNKPKPTPTPTKQPTSTPDKNTNPTPKQNKSTPTVTQNNNTQSGGTKVYNIEQPNKNYEHNKASYNKKR